MSFKEAHEQWFARHVKARSGERLRRLREGHAHGERLLVENVWWPAAGSLDYLHPEYQVYDFRDGFRYLDLAYLRPPYRVNVELDSFGAHNRDDRRKLSDDLTRQNHLVLDRWIVLRFSYDDVKEKPRQCQQTIQQMLGSLFGVGAETSGWELLPLVQREIVRHVIRTGKPITPSEAAAVVGLAEKAVRNQLHDLVDKTFLLPNTGDQRVRSYKLNPEKVAKQPFQQ